MRPVYPGRRHGHGACPAPGLRSRGPRHVSLLTSPKYALLLIAQSTCVLESIVR